MPVQINDASALVNLVYIDDVVHSFTNLLLVYQDGKVPTELWQNVEPVYSITVGQLAAQILEFKKSRKTLLTEDVGVGLVRALHATYLSFLTKEDFVYQLPRHEDPRGVFVEMLKTKTSGQFSFFTAHPGVTRGGHYHHSKTEKFLVIKGTALYKFRHVVTQERYEIVVDSSQSMIVETIPGWAHDITNIGADELIVMLWANEIFDRERPDTIGHKV